MLYPILGLLLGILLGGFIPINIPPAFSNYIGVGILGALDSIFGAITATLQKKFEFKIFITGFFGNAVLAVLLSFIGDRLGIQMYLVVMFAFGNRVFLNFAIIRRMLLQNKNNQVESAKSSIADG